jgi:hypothetical protein
MSNELRRPLPALIAGLFAACLLQGPAKAADQDPRDEIDFARGLATDWQFVDIAEQVLARVEGEATDADLRAEVALARCEVYGAGARWALDAAQRESLFLRALDGYQAFIDNNGRSPLVDRAAAAYVDLGAAYIGAMEATLAEAVGEDAERIRSGLQEQVENLLRYSGSQVNRLAGYSNAIEKQEYGRQLLYRAQIALAAYRLVEQSELFFLQIQEAVETIAYEFGDLSGYGLSAYNVLGEAFLEKGEAYDAASMFEFVVEQTIPTDVDSWSAWIDETKPSRERLDGLWYFVEMASDKWLDALAASGDRTGAVRAALHYQNTWRREGFSLSPRGHLSLLAAARVLLDANGFLGGSNDSYEFFDTFEAAREAGVQARRIKPTAEVALELASVVNDENRGNNLQVRAQRLIADAIGRPGVEVGVETLFEAAKGYYNAKDYPTAISAMRGVLSSIDNEADARLYAPRILFHIGRSFGFQDRDLEAAMAYREALVEWQGDPEYDEQNASGFYNSMRRLRRDLSGDARIEELYRESEVLMTSLGADPGTITYRQGTRDFDAGDFASARTSFQAVDRSAPIYEKALVKAARCTYELGELEAAMAAFDAYLEDYVSDPTNRLGATDQGARTVRDEAMAEASFYKGQIYWDQSDFNQVIALYRTFPERFDSQPDLVAAALYYCVAASLEDEDVAGATAFHDALLADHATSDFTGNGATLIFNTVKDRYEVAQQSGDDATAARMLAEMANYAEVSNSLRDVPDFNALLTEARLWRDLANWDKAAEDFGRLVNLFGDSADSRELRLIERSAIPDLADALLHLERVQDAFDLVAPLVPDPDVEGAGGPTEQTVEVYCRAVAGWVTGDPRNPTVVPGVGGAENYAKAGPWWRKLSNSHEKWLDCDWYRTEFSRAWTYFQWGKEDSAQSDVAREIVQVIRAETGAGFDYVQENCGGDNELRDKFRWLSSQL